MGIGGHRSKRTRATRTSVEPEWGRVTENKEGFGEVSVQEPFPYISTASASYQRRHLLQDPVSQVLRM